MSGGYVKLFQQDDAAPDSLEYFRKRLTCETGLPLSEFKKQAELNDDGFTLTWTSGVYRLSIAPDDPFYTLEKLT